MLRFCLALLLTSLLTTAIPAAAQDALPSYEGYRYGRFLRYLDAQEGPMTKVPRIGLSFGERTLNAVLDSGSTGIVVAARYIPDFESLPSTGEGRLTYSSSGRVMVGQWVVTRVGLVGRDGERVETEPMPVLAVTRVECWENARHCTPHDDPSGIAMVGVGFAREGDHQSQSMPDKNPLLRIAGGGSERRQGYILSPEGVHVGLTGANTRGDFRYIKLQRAADRPDWEPLPACISINGQTPPACGSMLMDTGVSTMFITLPSAQAAGNAGSLPPGTDVSIGVGGPQDGFHLYRFAMGDGSLLAPDSNHLRVSETRTFVNTSFHLLNGFDMLYDAEGGYVGFRRR
ncbi:MAG: hypothetical protein ABWY35_10870 [Pseudorhodoplanes sp.]